ncbi:hypothetical protein AB8A28_24875 [Tardiphaga sp. 71_E8_N1_1]|uniref:hypothetical protein n=1 Tax=Tardiphaga sp. 71_E8_N1_1 TaxID=3240784 RepID=UPI003F89340B
MGIIPRNQTALGLFYDPIDKGGILNSNVFNRQIAPTSDEQSLIKARYCRSILKVAAISTEQEARILLNGLATEQLTSNTSAPMAEAERAALAAIRELAGYLHGRIAHQGSTEWSRAMRGVENWLNVHDR